LNPSLDFSLVDMIDAIEPNRIEPTTEAKTNSGIVRKLNSIDSKKSGYQTAVIKVALINPIIPIVYTLLRM